MKIEPAAAIDGHIAVPGDKSLSHRAVLLSAVGEGETRISGFGRSEDTESTIKAVRDLGVRVYEADPETLRVFGNGLRGLTPPNKPIDCGNAGTLMRLLPGLLAGQEGRFELTGDESLRSRPMERIAEPLRRMGANVTVFNRRRIGGEPAGDLDIRPSQLVGATIGDREVPLLVDELPLFALLAVHAHGDSVLRGAAELRAKETDRIEAVVDGLRRLGAHIRATPDGFTVRGVPSRIRGGGAIDARGDHRIAMLGAITGLVSREGVEVLGAESAAVSFPGFYDLLDSLRALTTS